MSLFKLKFTITIQELYNEYAKHKKGDSIFLCHFIKSNLLPRRSIYHWLYFKYTHIDASSQFMTQLGELLNTPRTTYLHEMVDTHPDFIDLTPNEVTLTADCTPRILYTHIEFRKNVLKRILELHPNATFTFHY
jgi:hypothetical protein